MCDIAMTVQIGGIYVGIPYRIHFTDYFCKHLYYLCKYLNVI